MSNGTDMAGWEADAISLATFTLAVVIDFTIDVDNAPSIDDSIDDAYVTQWTASGSKTKSYVFSRETLNAASLTTNAFAPPPFYPATITSTKFQIGKGFRQAGEGAECPPVFRASIAELFLPAGAPTYEDESESWDIGWAHNYTKVGPNTGAPIPTNDSGTESAFLHAELTLTIAGETPSWGSQTFFTGGSTLPDGEQDQGLPDIGLPIPVGLLSEDGPDIFRDSLLTKAGGLVNFGATQLRSEPSWDPAEFTINDWTADVTITITCS